MADGPKGATYEMYDDPLSRIRASKEAHLVAVVRADELATLAYRNLVESIVMALRTGCKYAAIGEAMGVPAEQVFRMVNP